MVLVSLIVTGGSLILLTPSENVQAQGSSDLVASWHFNESSGTIVTDSSGNGNNGTIYGATWAEGISGTALEFDD